VMRVTEAVARIFYRPLVRKCIHRLGLGRGMKRLYALVRGNGKILKLNLNGVEGLFSVQTPGELCFAEGSVLFNEREMLNAVQETLKPGDVFLDVGSNLGIFTIFGAKAVGPQGTVVACEPATSAFNRLQNNIDLNRLNNIKLLKLALSDTRSMKKLLIDDLNALGGTLAHLSDADGPSEDVRTAEYDSLVEDEGLPIPRVVKMDIEGHEYTALKGMERTLSNPVCGALFCEIHPYALPGGVSFRDVVTLIESFGFDCVSTRMRGTEHQVTAMKHATRCVIGQRHEADANADVGSETPMQAFFRR
jgi:FkbM family methyltransferase